MEKALLLELRVVAKHQVSLTIEDLTCQLGIAVEVDQASGETWMDTHHTVKSHNRVWTELKALRVTLL